MIMSPGSQWGSNCWMIASTAGPALTNIISFRGRLTDLTKSSIECVPTKFFPLARPSINASTFSVVRL